MTKPGYGTIENPISLTIGMSYAFIGAGNTIYLRGGVYSGDINDFSFTLLGTAEQPITVMPYNNERVVLDCNALIGGSYVIWKNIEFCWTGWPTRESETTTLDFDDKSININAVGCKIVNCIIHDMIGVGSWILSTGAELYGNVIYHIGWQGSDRGHGHGLYCQNQTGRKTIKHNVIFNNFGWGFHGYTEHSYVDNFDLVENTVFGSGAIDALGKHPDILLGGTNRPSYGSVMDGNLTYGGSVGLIAWSQGFRDLALRNNRLPNGINKDASDTYSEDTNNTVGSIGDAIYVYPNTYQDTRANVTIYNEAGADSVTVDLSTVTGLNIGDAVTAWNVQAGIGNDMQTLTLDANKCISVDMQAANRSVAAPICWTAPATTFPTFGCFVVQKA